MKILIVSATWLEVKLLADELLSNTTLLLIHAITAFPAILRSHVHLFRLIWLRILNDEVETVLKLLVVVSAGRN